MPPPTSLILPRVFFDVTVGGRVAGRLVFKLFDDTLPQTCENFRCLATGETGLGYWMRPRWYQGTRLHRIIPGFMAQGGDFNFENGQMNEGIYGQHFRDEKFLYSHDQRGVVSMSNSLRKHTNGGQFFITLGAAQHLDGKHVAFGIVEDGWNTLDAIEEAGTPGGKPRYDVAIFKSGQLLGEELNSHLDDMRKRLGLGRRVKGGDGLDSAKYRPSTLPVPDSYDPVPEEVYQRARPFFDNTL